MKRAKKLPRLSDKDIKRFYSYIKQSGDCKIWDGCKDKDGYGILRINYGNYRVHRIAFFLHNGYIDNDLDVLHQCDTPMCLEGTHLFQGTPDDNAQDRVMKGRSASMIGEKNPNVKLTVSQVLEIRQSLIRTTVLMERYHVSRSTINRIRDGSLWPNLKQEYLQSESTEPEQEGVAV